MLFIDASAYLSLLNPHDNNHQVALVLAKKYHGLQLATSQAVLGEVITVGSQRFNKALTIKFVDKIINSQTLIFLEEQELVNNAWTIFKKVKSKNISWVDCYSKAIIDQHQIKKTFTFDKDFKKLSKI